MSIQKAASTLQELKQMIHDFHAAKVEQCRYCARSDGKIYSCDPSSCHHLGNGPHAVAEFQASMDYFNCLGGEDSAPDMDGLDSLSGPALESALFDCALSIQQRCVACKQGHLAAVARCRSDRCPLSALGPPLVRASIDVLNSQAGGAIIGLGDGGLQ